ncbi:hypothetical protein Tco_1186013 [Tanacetum coccineum]
MEELTIFLRLQVKQKNDGIFISQDKYMAEILNKFDFLNVKTTSTPMESNKALIKDTEAEYVDVYLYRSMIGSLMYLTASRLHIMFVVYACARFQVTPKISHLHAVKRIFRYLKGQPKLGLWYLKDSPFGLEAFSDSDYARASLDRKSTTRGCQFLSKRLISWQCKKQTIVANSTNKVEYVVAANYCGDSYEKRLIEVIKIHKDHNVVDLLTTAFNVSRFNFIIASIGEVKCGGMQLIILERNGTTVTDELEVSVVSQDEPSNLVVFEAIYEEMYDILERVATTATSLEAEHDSIIPIVYVSSVDQFWMTAQVKKFNDEGRIDCLPNATIFEEISRMGYERLTQKLTFYKAFFIICLSTNQRFNFSKFILEGRIRNLDAKAVKFLMYPRFIQLFVNQLEGLPVHYRKYKVPCHTKKIFANMKRTNKDFSGNDTPLFPTMVVQAPPPPTIIPPPTTTITPPPTTSITPPPTTTTLPTITTATTSTTPPSTTSPTPASTLTIPTTSVQPLQPRKQRIRRRRDTEVTYPSERTMVDDDTIPNESNDPLSGDDRLKLTELMNLCTTLQSKGRRDEGDEMLFDAEKYLSGEEVILEGVVTEKVAEKEVAEEVNLNEDEITLAQTLQKLKSTPKAKGVAPKSKGVTISEPSDTHRADIPKQNNIDKGKAKMIESEKPLKRKDQILLDKEEARRLQEIFDEEARMAEEEAEKEAKLVEEWDNVKEKMDADYELASKL